MAQKGNNQLIILEGSNGHRYYTTKNVRNNPDKLELKKYNPTLKKHEVYKEGKNKFK